MSDSRIAYPDLSEDTRISYPDLEEYTSISYTAHDVVQAVKAIADLGVSSEICEQMVRYLLIGVARDTIT
jgi:hypothetical protein